MLGEFDPGFAPTWRGPFASWEAAEDAASVSWSLKPGSLFDSQAWLRRQLQFRESIDVGEASFGVSPLPRSSTLPLLVQGISPPRIVDLGGGSGWVLDLLRRSALTVSEYVVIDRPDVCAFFRQREDASRRFVSFDTWETLPPGETPCDIVYCNSALQYSKSNRLLLELVQTLQPQWVLLDDTLVSGRGGRDTFAVQLNSDNPEPVRCLSVGSLAEELASIGLDLVWRMPFAQPGYRNLAETTDESVLPKVPVPESLLFRAG